MPLFLLTVLTMVAFAANSLLNRAGVDLFGMDALAFAAMRLLAGALTLAVLVGLRGGWPVVTRRRIASAAALLLYLVPFSLAYVTLPSGLGALILFGVVQISMFAGSAIMGQRPGALQFGGMGVSMAGLGWLLWPGGDVIIDPVGAIFMAVAGAAWGMFSLLGRGSRDPLGDMAWSFVLLLPVAAVLFAVVPLGGTGAGYAAAVVSGAMTSGLGYALWYRVLPRIASTTGAVAQLSVPIIALCAGAVLLGEALTVDVVIAAIIVLGGIGLAVLKR